MNDRCAESRAKEDWVHLGRAPELAMVAIAGQALELCCELWAEHPELVDEERPYWVASGHASGLARVVMRCAALAQEAMCAYGEAVCEGLDRDRLGRGGR